MVLLHKILLIIEVLYLMAGAMVMLAVEIHPRHDRPIEAGWRRKLVRFIFSNPVFTEVAMVLTWPFVLACLMAQDKTDEE